MRYHEFTARITEGAEGYFHVLSKGGHARVINENDPALIKAWKDGWQTEWDSARSIEQGFKWASDKKGLTPEPPPRETGSPFWLVFSKDGLARAIPEDEVDLRALRTDGWKLEFNSVRSAEEGLRRAREQRGLKAWDSFLPRVMTEAKPLYRSVSLPELLDIARTGTIMGGGNTFNEHDPRRYVFFADAISDELIFQGADTERQTQRLMADHPIQKTFKTLTSKLATARQQVADGIREYQAEINRRRTAAGHPALPQEETLLAGFAKHGGSVAKIAELLPRDPKDPASRQWQAYQKLNSKMTALQTEYGSIFRARHKAHAADVGSRPITSAIIETKPLTGGLEYSVEAGSRMGMDAPEYGFERGAVTLDDVVRVYWVKDREIISSGSPDQILPKLKEIRLAG